MPSHHITVCVFVLLAASTLVSAQDRGIELVHAPEFRLSKSAVAAGIDGTMRVSFTVDRNGKVKSVNIVAGPIWPCRSSPSSEIRAVRDAVRENIFASRFSPATKGGKPINADATLDFAIGEAYGEALKGKTPAKSRWVVDVGSLQARAARLPLPAYTGFNGTATVRVLIGETGNVISAGTVEGHPALQGASRSAACNAKFPPTIVDGKPVKVTGFIYYDFFRGIVRAR